VLALGAVELSGQKMQRGDVKVFKTGERYSPPKDGEYLEVVIKPGHPKVMAPTPGTPPAPGNKVLYDGKDFTIFEEKMQPGELSSPHSHNQRLAIFLNKTQVQQWTDGKDETRELVPDLVTFRPAVVHTSKDVGTVPIRKKSSDGRVCVRTQVRIGPGLTIDCVTARQCQNLDLADDGTEH